MSCAALDHKLYAILVVSDYVFDHMTHPRSNTRGQEGFQSCDHNESWYPNLPVTIFYHIFRSSTEVLFEIVMVSV